MTRKPSYDTILNVVIGSHANGYATEESDRDEQGVCIESLEDFVGFNKFEQDVIRTSEIREGVKNARSLPGDTDSKIYSLHKFLRLALAGNPDVIAILFNRNYITCNALGRKLQELYPLIVSKQAGKKFLGYMNGQRQQLLRGKGMDVTRKPLIDKYGWDVKFGTHIVRLAYQGIEILEAGKLVLPMSGEPLEYCKRVRSGQASKEEVLAHAEVLESKLFGLIETSQVREHPDIQQVESWMIETYYMWWRCKRFMTDRMAFRTTAGGGIEPVWTDGKSEMRLSELSASTVPTSPDSQPSS